MELRHLRYFIAVAEEGSLTLAAQKRLHTAQPSLSRQIRDLEFEVGVELLSRTVHGVELTAAGKAFLDQARLALLQVEAAGAAARRAVQLDKASVVLGFLTGHEMQWLPEAMRLLREVLPNADVTVTSQTSPELAAGLLRGKIDVAFLRREEQVPGLIFKLLTKEPLVVVLPEDHRLAARKEIDVQEIVGETFVGVPKTSAPTLRVVIDDYARQSGIVLKPDHEVDNLTMAISLVASTGGVSLLPLYAVDMLPPFITNRPLRGKAPIIDLVVGYNRANTSAALKSLVSRLDELIARVSANGNVFRRTRPGQTQPR
jgi:LysR family hca operon transcriptional activator